MIKKTVVIPENELKELQEFVKKHYGYMHMTVNQYLVMAGIERMRVEVKK